MSISSSNLLPKSARGASIVSISSSNLLPKSARGASIMSISSSNLLPMKATVTSACLRNQFVAIMVILVYEVLNLVSPL